MYTTNAWLTDAIPHLELIVTKPVYTRGRLLFGATERQLAGVQSVQEWADGVRIWSHRTEST